MQTAKSKVKEARRNLDAANGKLSEATAAQKALDPDIAQAALDKANAALEAAKATAEAAARKLEDATSADDTAGKALAAAQKVYDAAKADKDSADKALASAKALASKLEQAQKDNEQAAHDAADRESAAKQNAKDVAGQALSNETGTTGNGDLAVTGATTALPLTMMAIASLAGAGCVFVKMKLAHDSESHERD